MIWSICWGFIFLEPLVARVELYDRADCPMVCLWRWADHGITYPSARSIASPSVYSFGVIHPSASHIIAYPSACSFSVLCPPSASHIQASNIIMRIQCHVSKCLFIWCLAYPCGYSFSVSHLQALIHSVYHVPECPTYLSVWFPSVSHIRVRGFRCLTSPSAYSFGVSCPVCLTYPSAWF